jgi:hypothetical protein
VIVPVLLANDVFAATVKPTAPGPDPAAPELMEIHGTLLVAFHTQPAAVVTVLVPEPPAAANDCGGVETTGVQATAPNEKVFVREPSLRPPGPNASTSAS